jgi:DNA polymerase III psi subunit
MIHPAKHQHRQSVFQNAVQNGPQPKSLNGDVSISRMFRLLCRENQATQRTAPLIASVLRFHFRSRSQFSGGVDASEADGCAYEGTR